MRKAFMFISSVVLSVTLATAEERAPATAMKLDAPPVLDGRLDEPFWRDTQPLTNFYVWGKDAAGRRVTHTEVRLAHDDAWLYLGIKCDNPLQKLVLDPQTREHDGPVSADESVELFFSSDGTGKVYYHFMLSCFNIKAEQRIINGGRERQTWNQPWRSATAITADGWTAEVALPLCLFLEYGDLEHVRLNITRNRRMPFMDACNVITHEAMEYSTWRPVTRSFHEPAAFGALAPLDVAKLRMPFMPALESVAVQPYAMTDGTNHYTLDIIIKCVTPTTGLVELAVIDQPAGGPAATTSENIALAGNQVLAKSIIVPAATPAERSITIELRVGGSGEVLQAMRLDRPKALEVMRAWLDRNYHTTEETATAVAEIGMPPAALIGMEMAVELAGQTLATTPAAAETRLEFPLTTLAPGNHPVKIALRRPDGECFAWIDTELIKHAPKPGCEVKVDQINRVILKDGQPLFPIGLIMNAIKPEHAADFKTIADAGCNTFFQWHKTMPAAEVTNYLAQAKEHGLLVISLLETGWQSPKEAGMADLPTELAKALSKDDIQQLLLVGRGGELALRGYLGSNPASRHPPAIKTALYREYVNRNLPIMEKLVASLMEYDNLLAYSSFDEPYDSRRYDMTRSLADVYQIAHRVDGYHPVKVLYSSHIPEGDEYVTPCDVLVTDPYWVPGGTPLPGPVRNSPNFVSKIVHWTDQRAAKFRKPVWVVPMAPICWSQTRKRLLTGAELDCQNFLAIIHGARGLFWFRYPMQAEVWGDMVAAIRKINRIGPMAVQPAVAQTIRHMVVATPDTTPQAAGFAPEREEYPDVQGKIFRDPADGGLVLIAANSRYYPVHAQFSSPAPRDTVQRIFTNATLPVTNGQFEEILEPFAVRAYQLGHASQEPVTLTITSHRPAGIPPPETSWPNGVRPGQKNLFPNPSFEETTIPGIPDYYFGSDHAGGWSFGLDATGTAKFGKHALKMTRAEGVGGPPPLYWSCMPRHDQPTPHVWSFWAKGAQGGEKLYCRHESSNLKETVTLTDTWRRYTLPVVVPAQQAGDRADFMINLINGTIWLDGLQLEQGYEATEFED